MENTSNFQGSIPGAPPPPSEVKVRTMRSDLESMTRSGGGAPRFENVAVTGLTMQDGAPQAAETAGGQSGAVGTSLRSLLGPVLVIIVALVALAVVGYFAYTVFNSSASQTPAPAATPTTP
jgi:hypothetical protein